MSFVFSFVTIVSLAGSMLMVEPASASAREIEVAPGELKTALATARPGDVLALLPGFHGDVVVRGRFEQEIRIRGRAGAVLGRTVFQDAARWRLENVDFRGGPASPGSRSSLVETDRLSSGLSFVNCSFATGDDTDGWTPEDWVARPYQQALLLRGAGMSVIGSHFFNVRNALAVFSDDSLIEANRFERFGNDAIAFGANRLQIVGNSIGDGRHSAAEKLHADAMQGYPAPDDGSYSEILIADNTIRASPRADYLQGISAFDGRWRNVAVRRNHVVTSAYHGISWYGVDGIVIEDNEVIEERPGSIIPWIAVLPAKTGRPSSGVVVQRNQAPAYKFR